MFKFCQGMRFVFLSRRGIKTRETEYECGRVVWERGWYPDGAPIPEAQLAPSHAVPQETYDACMVKWRAYQEKLKRGEIAPLPVLP